MRLVTAVLLSFVSTAALAANTNGPKPATGTSKPTPPAKIYVLKVDEQDLALLGTALGARPYSEVAALIAKLDVQIVAQSKPVPSKP